jgi:hypothetical protein
MDEAKDTNAGQLRSEHIPCSSRAETDLNLVTILAHDQTIGEL